MQIYNYDMYKWNHCVGPAGNLGGVDPDIVAQQCDKYGIPWYSSAWPYASGIKAYCVDDNIWGDIIAKSKS